MSEIPDVNGEFEVEGLPEAPGDGEWSIYKYPGEPNDWPNEWDWQGGLYYIMKLTCDGTDEYTQPLIGFEDSNIALLAETLIALRARARRGSVADTTTIHPIPKA